MSDTLTNPWYLRPNYSENDLVIDADGNVQAATVPALVERLTTHETSDPAFVKTFLLTYKSFTTLDELFDLLVQRFYISPPGSLVPTELEEWKKLKQHVVQSRVLDTFETMTMDVHVIENGDMSIFDRMKEFLQQEVVSPFATSRRVLAWIDRAQGGELNLRAPSNAVPVSPPEPIVPVTNNQLGFLDVDPLELARQLTLLESQLYQQIRPTEWLARLRDGMIHHGDNIARIIQVANGLVNWVADAVLSQNDPRARAAFLKQFILVADSCRSLQNYSSMVAILCGLNSPLICRLRHSWELVNPQDLAQLDACETIINSANDCTQHRLTLANIAPPCVPFIGVFLITLASVRKGSDDTLPGNLVNFRKRQEISTVIQDIQRWQALPHHFHPLPLVQTYIEESLGKFNNQGDVSDMFWNLSLEREPRENADEMMTRLPKESRFL